MKELIVFFLVVLGSVFILIAAIGVLRFKDVFSSMHATTKASSFGLLLIITGVALHFLTVLIWIKAVLMVAFIYLTAPLAAHAVSQSLKNIRKK